MKITVLTGAGISAESGLGTFRDNDGLWAHYRIEDVCTPEALIRNRPLVVDFYNQRRKETLAAQPNAAHVALKRLEEKYDVRIVTQNIDDLHQRAGSRNVLELHGSVYRNRCLHCGAFYSLDALLKKLDASPDGVPRCGCGGVIKPDVVLYGEGLDQAVLSAAIAHISRADLLIIGGTSLMVYPAAALIDYFRGRHVVVINLSDTGRETGADLTIRRSIDEVLSEAVD